MDGVDMREHSENKKKWVKIDFADGEDERPVCRFNIEPNRARIHRTQLLGSMEHGYALGFVGTQWLVSTKPSKSKFNGTEQLCSIEPNSTDMKTLWRKTGNEQATRSWFVRTLDCWVSRELNLVQGLKREKDLDKDRLAFFFFFLLPHPRTCFSFPFPAPNKKNPAKPTAPLGKLEIPDLLCSFLPCPRAVACGCDLWAFFRFPEFPPTLAAGLPPNCSPIFAGKILEAKSRTGKNEGSDELEG
ncbi:hypothetical protein SLEP1_g24619 [Rubroshorea leprosula]|uniref:Uncharacterized protein n=1 Tax=Rubroshorea leprosula TaxID=152421 RepID=A0AAV5JRS4_9ROSI|nr:hypothetical protein SLEP1_g24619 [Rubroshorea leprosula]